LSGRGLCDELITRPEESYRLCCVVVCDLETSRIGAPYIYNVRLLRVKQHVLQGDLDITHVISFAVMHVTLLPPRMGEWVDVIGAVETNFSYPVDTQNLN